VWQELRSEPHPQGLEIVTVALDTAGAQAARPWIEAAKSEHPTLIDQAHILDELLGVVNVPNGVWIDENGMIVRPAEPAYASRPVLSRSGRSERSSSVADQEETPQRRRAKEIANAVKKIRIQPELYVAALRDWVANGSASSYALSPGEVIRRSHPRPPEVAQAAASFEIGQYLYRLGYREDAVPWFRNAHRLQPYNWTYKRQAWTFADPGQGPTELYDGDWLSDVLAFGPENYYPGLDM